MRIDGGRKSGSGTIVRTAAAIAAITRRHLEIFNIRARRQPPGLRPQHLRALQAARDMTGGLLAGAEPGSSEIRFEPGHFPQGGDYIWEIGTAGSTTMLAMTVLPLGVFADEPATFSIQGGVFQDFAPSGFHLQHCLLPLLTRMGFETTFKLVRPGYYPRGGGLIEVGTRPLKGPLLPLRLPARSGELEIWGIALSSHLERRKVSDRLAESCAEFLNNRGHTPRFRSIYDHTAPQPGAALALFGKDPQGCLFGADMAGAPGRRSEQIGKRVAKCLWQDLQSGATLDRHLADQLILYASLARGTSEYVFPRLTDHIETNLWLVQEFLGAGVEVEGQRLRIEGIGYQRG